MAHTLILKTITTGLENWAKDCVSLAEFLDLRTNVPGIGVPPSIFQKKDYADPKPGTYPTGPNGRAQLLVAAADKLDSVASLNADTLTFLGGNPSNPGTMAAGTSEDDLLRLIVAWQSLASGFFKASLRMYGLDPEPHPAVRHPGPASEERHLAILLAWLSKIETDAKTFQQNQGIAPNPPYHTPPGTGSFHDSLLRVEQAYHKLALDISLIALRLPYHLLGAQI